VVCLAGFDPTGGAGLLADVAALAVIGVRAAGVITAMTRQRPVGPATVEAVEAERLEAVLPDLLRDLEPEAVKIGMLGSAEAARTIARHLSPGHAPIVLDPVLQAGAGGQLTAPEAIRVILEQLAPLSTVLTPNVPEAEQLTGLTIRTEAEMEQAARRLLDSGAQYVLLKGGHLAGDPVDLLVGADGVRRLPAPRLPARPVHGTGCTLSSLIAGRLAQGVEVAVAVEESVKRVREGIRDAWAPQAAGWSYLGAMEGK